MITGIIPATGNTPTAGTGFTYTHTNGTGSYVFTYSTPFSAVPDLQVTCVNGSAFFYPIITAQSASGFTIVTRSEGTGNVDSAFNFLAVVVT